MRHPRPLRCLLLENRLTPATAMWDGGSLINNLWTTPQNWVGDVAPNAGDDLVFQSGLQQTNVNDFAAGTNFRSIAINANNFQLSGNAVSLTAGIVGSNANSSHIGMNLTLAASQTFSNISGLGYFIDGSIDLNGKTLTFDIGGSGGGGGLIPPQPVFVSVPGVIQGAGAIFKDGIQPLLFAGNNTFTGPVDVRAGTLSLNNNNAAGAAGAGNATTVEGGAILASNGGNFTIPEAINFANSTPQNQSQWASGFPTVITLTGPITLNGRSRWLTGEVVIANGLLGTGSLSVQGALTFAAGSVSTYNGTLNGETQPLTFNGTGPNGQITANDSRGVAGTGSIGPLTIQGTTNTHLTPGDSGVGTLTTGNLIAGCLFDVDIDATGSDKVVVHGTVALGGTLTVFPASGFTLPANAVYRIIDNDGTDFVGGAFANALQGAVVTTINGVPLYINYRGGDGNDMELTTTQPPPLPGPRPFFAVAAGKGGGPQVKVYDESGALVRTFLAYDASFTGGVHVAVADVNGDGIRDIITAPGQGGGPVVRVWDGATGQMVTQYNAYDPSFRGGVFVAAARIDNNAVADIVTGAGAGGGPHVKVFSGASTTVLAQWMAYDLSFFGGVSVAATDGFTTGGAFTPGTVVTGAGPGGGPHVRTFNGLSAGPLTSFFAYETGFTGGVYVAGGNFNGNGQSQIVTAPGVGGSPQVKVFNLQNSQLLNTFNAYDASFHGGVFVAVTDADGTGQAQLVTGAGPGGGPHVKTWRVTPGGIAPPTTLTSFLAFDPAFLGGVFVG